MDELGALINFERMLRKDRTLITEADVKDMMDVLKTKKDLIDYYENRHKKIEKLFKRREFILNARYFHILQQLEDVKKAFELYRMTISNIEKELTSSPVIVKLVTEIAFYHDYKKILAIEQDQVNNNILEEQKKIKGVKKLVIQKSELLKNKNKANLDLATKITRLTAMLNNHQILNQNQNNLTEPPALEDFKSHLNSSQQLTHDILTKSYKDLPQFRTIQNMSPEPVRRENLLTTSINNSTLGVPGYKKVTSRSVSLIRIPKTLDTSGVDYENLYKVAQSLIKKNANIKSNIITKISNHNKLYDLFLDCYGYHENLVYKTQKIAKGQNLNGSLIFLLMNSKQRNMRNLSPVNMKDTSQLEKKSYQFKPKAYVKESEYEIIDSMYKAFKGMIDKTTETDKIKLLLQSVKKEHFDGFTSMQLMGLILLRPELVNEIIREFDEKGKKMMQLSLQLKKTKVSAEI
jgi:hypothetical protein